MIALRAWSKDFEEMYYAERDDTDYGCMKREYAPFVFCLGFSRYNVDDIILMLGSNHLDKNNKMIYENDFVKIKHNDGELIGEAKFINGCFYICFKTEGLFNCLIVNYDSECYEIIGNRYEDPELIEDLN